MKDNMQVTYTKHYLQVLVNQALKGIRTHREHASNQWIEDEKELKTEYSEMPWFKKLFVESYRKRLAAIDDYCMEWVEIFNEEMYLANQLDAALKDALDETLKVDIKAIYMLRNVIELTEHMIEKENNATNS